MLFTYRYNLLSESVVSLLDVAFSLSLHTYPGSFELPERRVKWHGQPSGHAWHRL